MSGLIPSSAGGGCATTVGVVTPEVDVVTPLVEGVEVIDVDVVVVVMHAPFEHVWEEVQVATVVGVTGFEHAVPVAEQVGVVTSSNTFVLSVEQYVEPDVGDPHCKFDEHNIGVEQAAFEQVCPPVHDWTVVCVVCTEHEADVVPGLLQTPALTSFTNFDESVEQ